MTEHPDTARSEGFARGRLPLSGWLLAMAVGVAFADASIVVLATPDLLATYHGTVSAASWVVTGYNVAVVLAAGPCLLLVRRRGWTSVTAIGLAVFLAASLGCAGASSLGLLTALRVIQGCGAALLLTGALPLLARLAGAARPGLAVWSAAAALGSALGPAAGGLLTELFSWRAIFLAQAPFAAAAIAVLPRVTRAAPAAEPVTAANGAAPATPVRRIGAHLALALVSAALVGALFLVVLLMINGWGATPLAAAAVATAIPVGTLVSRPLAAERSPRAVAVAGCLTVAGGLAALAAVPDRGWFVAGAALAVTGLGLGLAVPTLTDASIRTGPRLGADGAMSVVARHAGLVLALGAVTPLLAAGLTSHANRAIVVGTEAGLSTPAPLRTKVSLARSLGATLSHTPTGKLPDLAPAFRQVAPDGSLDPLRDHLSSVVTAAVTGAFRPSFALCALFAVLALAPATLVGGGPGPAGSTRAPPGRRAVPVVLAPALAMVVFVGAVAAGGRQSLTVPDPCQTQPAFARGGADGRLQQIALDALDGAACRLHTSRAALLLTLLPASGQPRLTLTDAELTPAVRDGLSRAVGRQVDNGSMPRWSATVLRLAIRVSPVGWLVDLLRSE
jgi:predicted MFS family arabinose efflux permease